MRHKMLVVKRKRAVLLWCLIIAGIITILFIPTLRNYKLSLFQTEETIAEVGNIEITADDVLLLFSVFAGAASLAAFIIVYLPKLTNRLPSMGLRKKR